MSKNDIIVVDFETTGVFENEIMPIVTEIGAVKFNPETFEIVDKYESLVYTPDLKLTEFIIGYTGITDKLLLDKGKSLYDMCKEFEVFCEGKETILAAWPISYEMPLLQNIYYKSGYKELPLSRRSIDIPTLFKYSYGKKVAGAASLNRALDELNIPKPKDRHRALPDAIAETQVLIECLKYFDKLEKESFYYWNPGQAPSGT